MMTTPLTFEVGKTYVTRAGDKRNLIHIFENGQLLFQFEQGFSKNWLGRRLPNGRVSERIEHVDDIVAEYREPVVQKFYSNVIEKVGGDDSTRTKMGDFVTCSSKGPRIYSPYANNALFEHRATLELVVTDGELTAVNIIRPD